MNPATREDFYAALVLYNRGEYLDCQVALEEVHAASDPEEQPLVRAILQLACGMHLHFNRGGGRGTLNLLRQSLITLDDFRPQYLGVETGDLYDAIDAYLQDLQERRKPGARFLDRWLAPRIRYQVLAPA